MDSYNHRALLCSNFYHSQVRTLQFMFRTCSSSFLYCKKSTYDDRYSHFMNLKQFIYKVEKLQLTRSRSAESLLWIALLEISTNEGQTLLWERNKSNSMFMHSNISICININRTFSHPLVMTSSPPTFRDQISTLQSCFPGRGKLWPQPSYIRAEIQWRLHEKHRSHPKFNCDIQSSPSVIAYG